MTKKYRKKPIVIEAFKYDGDMKDSNGEVYVPDWAIDAIDNKLMYYGSIDSSPPCELFIRTGEPYDKLVNVGDYIIKENDEIFSCKPDIFKATYEEVEDVE